MLKLNMGCGHNKAGGYLNVDASPECAPDQVVDLEATPWPWADNSVDEVVFNHSLEHMGGDPKVFLAIMRELYRVCADGAKIAINVPHPRHDTFLNDPTHVRPITPDMLSLFDRDLNDHWAKTGAANSPLAHYTGVNFKVESAQATLDEAYLSQLQAGSITQAQLHEFATARNNVIREFRMTLRARKP